MPHRAQSDFFERKRPWSSRKDLILGYYLKPYLAKIAKLKAPILLVDGFAGPGRFADGSQGSPLIFRARSLEAMKRNAQPIHLVCIEADSELYAQLERELKKHDFAQAWEGTFLSCVDRILDLTRSHSTFLYLDPYTTDGLDWQALERLFANLMEGRSFEVLLNFNTPSFVRRGLGLLKPESSGVADEESDSGDVAFSSPPSIERLDRIVGGDWWRRIVTSPRPFGEVVQALAAELELRFRKWFNEVCRHPIFELPHHKVPKYDLLFGSRHPDALRLMNDAMNKSGKAFAKLATRQPTLFEIRPTALVPEPEELTKLILDSLSTPSSRNDVIIDVMRRSPTRFGETEIRRECSRLLALGRIRSESGKSRINDAETLILVTDP